MSTEDTVLPPELYALAESIADMVMIRLEERLGASMRPEEPAGNPDDLLTVAEAAKLVKFTEETIRDWIHAGKLRAGKRPYRILRRDLLAAAASKTSASASARVDAENTVAKLLGRRG